MSCSTAFSSPTPLSYTLNPIPRNLIPSLLPAQPQILWIGCSDSCEPHELSTLALAPEEFIVYRTAGNIFAADDASSLSTLEYALRVANVRHVVICGHYGCGIVRSAEAEGQMRRDMVVWLRPITTLRASHEHELRSISNREERDRRLVELHVRAQAQGIARMDRIREMLRDGELRVHAFVFDGEKRECFEVGF